MMKKLYEKSELGFALVWIGIYCVGMSIFDEISRSIGVESSATAVFGVAASLFLYFWLSSRVNWSALACASRQSPQRPFCSTYR